MSDWRQAASDRLYKNQKWLRSTLGLAPEAPVPQELIDLRSEHLRLRVLERDLKRATTERENDESGPNTSDVIRRSAQDDHQRHCSSKKQVLKRGRGRRDGSALQGTELKHPSGNQCRQNGVGDGRQGAQLRQGCGNGPPADRERPESGRSMKPDQAPLLVTMKAAAQLMGISSRTFHTLRCQGKVPAPVVLGPRALRWVVAELHQALAEMPRAQASGNEPVQLLRARIEHAKVTGEILRGH